MGKGGVRSVSLRRILGRGASEVLRDLLYGLREPLSVVSCSGEVLLGGGEGDGERRIPVALEGEILGWVYGNGWAESVASLLGLLARAEGERRALAREALDKYKEIHLLYRMSERMADRLDKNEVAALVLEEARRILPATGASVMLLDAVSGRLEILAGCGEEQPRKTVFERGEGIAGSVLLSGRAEILNRAPSDPRFKPGPGGFRALMCVPLRNKDRVRGVINMSHRGAVEYTAADLKLLAALASQAASAMENALLHERRLRQERIRGHLERYVPSQVVDLILEDPLDAALASESRHIAVLFSDIRGFSSTCESLAPEEVVTHLNRYFSAMVEEIFRCRGTVNKFVGDMIVALFGAPVRMENPERQAVLAAVSMQRRLRRLDDPWVREHFHTGVGLSSGRVVVGNIGAPQHMDYTAIGDEVNVAARLQAEAREGQVLVSRSVREGAQDAFPFRSLGPIPVKGRRRPVETFEVVYA